MQQAGRRRLLAAVLLACWPQGASANHALGSIKLDNVTFDKFLGIPGFSFLVKIDKSHAWGDSLEEFKTLCKLTIDVPNFLIGDVPTTDYGALENDALRARFGLGMGDYPAYYLFDKAHPAPEGLRYQGPVNASDLAVWLRQNKVQVPVSGVNFELDGITRAFLKQGSPDTLLSKARDLVKEKYSEDKQAPMYVKIMERIQAKGSGYLNSEAERVVKLMEGRNLAPEKKTEFGDKLRILRALATEQEEEEEEH